MPIQTNLNVAPYYDDFNEQKDFYKILFRPGVAVQARELNQMQTILQAQIERFGDNIFKQGTIIDGCHISYHNKLPFVKIKDVETDGTPVNVNSYTGLYIKNTSGLEAVVIKTVAGYESRDPDLNTLYLRYINSGTSKNDTAFVHDQTLTIFDKDDPIFKIDVNNGSAGFSKTDDVVVYSAIAIANSLGGNSFSTGFHVGDRIHNSGSANAVIVAIDTTSNTSYNILRIRPLANNLHLANSALWQFSAGDTITSANGGQTANVVSFVGTGAAAVISTDAAGQIDNITMTASGRGYYIDPYVYVASTTANTTQIAAANLTPQTYLSKVTVANSALTPTGYGYGMTVDEGVIYQKGYFSRVSKQLVVVEKYNTTADAMPDGKVVGFDTTEEIINSNIDTSLLDNAAGTFNETAPGANRLKLSPVLVVVDKEDAEANAEFFAITEFSAGLPYKQNRQTQYNIIGDEMAKRTFEESGDYVLDPFVLNTKASSDITDEPNLFNAIIDPGKAYINGYRVETVYNYTMDVPKGTDVEDIQNATVSLTYGNYIRLKEVGGLFDFKSGDQVTLYNVPRQYITKNAGGTVNVLTTRTFNANTGVSGSGTSSARIVVSNNLYENNDIIQYTGLTTVLGGLANNGVYYATYANTSGFSLSSTPGGANLTITASATSELHTVIIKPAGTARMRSLQLESGVPGTASAIYRLYLFEVQMNAGQNFKNVESVYYNSTNDGIGDVIQTYNALANTYTTVLVENKADTLMFYAGTTAVKSTNSISYTYRTSNTSLSANTLGYIQITAPGNDTFPYSTTLSTADKIDIIVVPQANAQAAANIGGAIAITSSSNTVTGSGGVDFLSALVAGDYIIVSNGSVTSSALQVAAIANSTTLTLSKNAGTTIASGNAVIAYPKNVPINMQRSTTTATRSANGSVLTISLGALNSSPAVSVAYNLKTANATAQVKTPNRSCYVRLDLSSNEAGTTGPWILGLPDVFRLRGVYKGANNTFTKTGTGVSNITSNFFVNHGQTTSRYGLSKLVRKPTSSLSLTTGDRLLIEFDVFTTPNNDIRTVGSYQPAGPVDDDLTLAQLTSSSSIVNTLEIPEMNDAQGNYYDLRDFVDFRPVSTNTAIVTTSAATATINPAASTALASGDKKFPIPNSDLTMNMQAYLGRVDRVIIDGDGDFRILKGTPGSDKVAPQPSDSLTISELFIPPYPSVAKVLSNDLVKIADTNVGNDKVTNGRVHRFSIVQQTSAGDRARLQPRGYKMTDIGDLERRIKDLEYYVSFTLAEAEVKSKTIPGLGGIDRFKFGFVVDSFVDYSHADINHPEFMTTITDGRLGPKTKDTVIQHVFETDSSSTLPAVSSPIVQQTNATDGPMPQVVTTTTTSNTTPKVTTTASNGQVVATTSNNQNVVVTTPVTQKTISVVVKGTSTTKMDGSVYEDREFKFSSLSGQATFYFSTEDSTVAFEVYYGSTPGFSVAGLTPKYTTSNMTSLTSADGTKMRAADPTAFDEVYVGAIATGPLTVLGGWNLATGVGGTMAAVAYPTYGTPSAVATTTIAGKVALDYSYGKLSWTHNPAWGQYVKVRAYKFKAYDEFFKENVNKGKWRSHPLYAYLATYPSDSEDTTSIAQPQVYTPLIGVAAPANNNILVWNGLLGGVVQLPAVAPAANVTTLVSPSKFNYTGTVTSTVPNAFTINGQGLTITGIQPSSYGAGALGVPNLIFGPPSFIDHQAFKIDVVGLKPQTTHTFMFDGKDHTSKCKAGNAALGAGLVSDITGKISFTYFYDAGIDEATSDLTERNRLSNLATGAKSFTIKNADDSSSATGTVTIKASMSNTAINIAMTSPANTTSVMVKATTTSNVAGISTYGTAQGYSAWGSGGWNFTSLINKVNSK